MVSIVVRAFDELVRISNMKDPRAVGLPFTSLFDMIILTLCYVAMLKFGPIFMASRKAFSLKLPIMLYNILQVVLNASLFTHSVYKLATDSTPYVLMCSAPHVDDSYYAEIEFVSVYAYHALKVLDLLDTVFFVLRKKDNQVSFLHVYHHLAVMWGTCMTVNYFPGGHFVFLGLLNALVHTIMYSYYFATLYRPDIKHSLTIKKLVTLTQLVQFVLLILHSGIPLLLRWPCGSPKALLALASSQNLFMLLMFGDFYVRNYIVAPRRKARLALNKEE